MESEMPVPAPAQGAPAQMQRSGTLTEIFKKKDENEHAQKVPHSFLQHLHHKWMSNQERAKAKGPGNVAASVDCEAAS